MSRKLLINNIMNSNPIMDGLYCWLDARDGINDSTIWKDRSGNGNDFYSNAPLTFSNNTYNFISENVRSYPRNDDSLIKTNQDFTISISLKNLSLSSKLGIFFTTTNLSNTVNGVKGVIRPEGKTIELYYEYGRNPDITSFKVPFSKATDVCDNIDLTFSNTTKIQTLYFNSEKIHSQTLNMNLTHNGGVISIGKNSSYDNSNLYSCDININSFKLYNRELTEEEIKYNHNYEKSIIR